MTALAIEAAGLRKRFGTTQAVDGVDLRVPVGAIYGFLGPNGAGKTTTLRMLATLLRPDAGTAAVLGHDVVGEPDAVRASMSLTGQFASVDKDLTAFENLVLLARLHGYSRRGARARAGELLEAFGLADASGRLAARLSGGMLRRLDLAAGIVVTPQLLFLDEPTTGLDPGSRRRVWELVREIVRAGTTVLLTTQYLDEADRLADRIAVIDHGRVVAEGTSGRLKASVGAGVLSVRPLDPDRRGEAADLLARELGAPVETIGPALSIRITGATEDEAGGRATRALAELDDHDIALADFSLGRPSLDEVFLALTAERSAA